MCIIWLRRKLKHQNIPSLLRRQYRTLHVIAVYAALKQAAGRCKENKRKTLKAYDF
jgi:hypothetical protein